MTAPIWQTPAGFLGTVTERTSVTLTLLTQNAAKFSIISGELPTGLTLSSDGIISGFPASVGGTISTQFVVRASDPVNSNSITDRTFRIDTVGLSNLQWVTTGLAQINTVSNSIIGYYLGAGFNGEYYVINKEPINYQLSANSGQISATLSAFADAYSSILYLTNTTGVDVGQKDIYREIGGFGITPGTTLTNVSYSYNSVYNGYQVNLSLPTNQGLSSGTQIILFDSLPYKQKIKYFINENDGELPPGITLSSDGLLSGIVDDNLGINYQISSGGYDSEKFDAFPYDHAVIVNGLPVDLKIRYVPKTYQFNVTAYNGIESVKRLFKILVVDPTNLNADTIYSLANGAYAAESSELVMPLWKTPTDLGTVRANTYEIIQLSVYDPYRLQGKTTYNYSTSEKWTPHKLYNPGDFVVYLAGNYYTRGLWDASLNQPYINNSQTSTWANTQFVVSKPGTQDLGNGPVKFVVGDYVIYDGAKWNRIPYNQTTYVCQNTTSSFDFDVLDWLPNQIPTYLELDTNSGALYGKIPYTSKTEQDFSFYLKIDKTDTIKQTTSSVSQQFMLKLKGDFNNDLYWATSENLGNLNLGYLSELSVVAKHSAQPLIVQYQIISGVLPAGLTLNVDGTITGRIDYSVPLGSYSFTVQATDLYNQSITRNFYLEATIYDAKKYTRIYASPSLTADKRKLFRDFLNDCVPEKSLYRPYDMNFGLQNELRLYLEYGIEQTYLDNFPNMMENYFYNKVFWLGDITHSPGYNDNGDHIYDVVYVNIVDPQENSSNQTVDTFDFNHTTYYSNSILNMKRQFESFLVNGNTLAVDEYQLPLWMRNLKNVSSTKYKEVVVLCYVLPGQGESVVSNMKQNNFNINSINFTIDRLVLENNLSYPRVTYLTFDNFKTNSIYSIPSVITNANNNTIGTVNSVLVLSNLVITTENGVPLQIEGL